MTISNATTTIERESLTKAIPHTTVSKDGRWRTFHKHAGLMQFIPSGAYFARAKVNGKIIRRSLETTVFTDAKNKLPDKVKEFKKPKAPIGSFKEARLAYVQDLENDHTLAEKSRQYRKDRIAALLKSWPGLDNMNLDKITESRCREWAKAFAEEFSTSNFNNTLGTLRAIIERGGTSRDNNPAFKIKKLGIKPTTLQLPEPEQFNKLVEAIDNGGSRYSHDCANLVQFLAFSGCRIGEAEQVLWEHVDWERNEIKIHNEKRSRRGNHHPFRFLPMISDLRQLLERLKTEQNPKATDRVCLVGECEKALTTACGMKDGIRLKRKRRGKEVLLGIGIERITHHDLRHLFATRCIESGVDIPTVSRWLGHVDGGQLAMKTYGHLRRTHSQQQAQLVTFAPAGQGSANSETAANSPEKVPVSQPQI